MTDLRAQYAPPAFTRTILSDTCVDAANRASRAFHRHFPGWALYCRIVRGDRMFDRTLEAWAIGVARGYARARKRNGQAVVAPRGRRNLWIAQAGRDALEYVITHRYPIAAHIVADRLGVPAKIYRKVRDSLAVLMECGFSEFWNEVTYRYLEVVREEKRLTVTIPDNRGIMEVRGSLLSTNFYEVHRAGDGNFIRKAGGDPDCA